MRGHIAGWSSAGGDEETPLSSAWHQMYLQDRRRHHERQIMWNKDVLERRRPILHALRRIGGHRLYKVFELKKSRKSWVSYVRCIIQESKPRFKALPVYNAVLA